MVNPAVVYCPANRKYFLYFKGNVYDPGWRGVHGVAISDEPAGPFRVLDDNVFEFETGTDQKLNAEDPYVWYHRKDRCFYAVFKGFYPRTGNKQRLFVTGIFTLQQVFYGVKTQHSQFLVLLDTVPFTQRSFYTGILSGVYRTAVIRTTVAYSPFAGKTE